MKTAEKSRAPVWLTIHAGLVYAFLYGPILLLAGLSFNRSPVSAVWTGFTWGWYVKLFGDSEMILATQRSLVVGLTATVVATAVGTAAALALSGKRVPARGVTTALIYLPIVIPEIVLGCALLSFFAAAPR